MMMILKYSSLSPRSVDLQRQLRIDTGVLRTMLHVGKYKHGTRSIEALLDMSPALRLRLGVRST